MYFVSQLLFLPKNQPIRKLNRYLGFPPAKRANPIRLVVSLGGPLPKSIAKGAGV